MALRVADTIRKWAGWCPSREAAAMYTLVRSHRTSSAFPPEGGARPERWVVHFSATREKRRNMGFFVAIVGTVLGFHLLRAIDITLATALLSAFVLAVAVIGLVGDIKKSTIEINRNAVVFYRWLFWPVVVEKGSIANVEVKENPFPVPLGLIVGAAAVLVVSLAGLIVIRVAEYTGAGIDGPELLIEAAYPGSILMFTIWLVYHFTNPFRYSRSVVITTRDHKQISIFTDDPGGITGALPGRGSGC